MRDLFQLPPKTGEEAVRQFVDLQEERDRDAALASANAGPPAYAPPMTLRSATDSGLMLGLMIGGVVAAIPASQNGAMIRTMAVGLIGGAAAGVALGVALYGLVLVWRGLWGLRPVRLALKWGVVGAVAGLAVAIFAARDLAASTLYLGAISAGLGALAGLAPRRS